MSTGSPICDRCGTWEFSPHADGCALKSPRVAYCAPLTSGEVAADRAAVRALVEALPKCTCRVLDTMDDPSSDCGEVATMIDISGDTYCDEHGPEFDACDLSYADEVIALLERMEAWT